MSSQNIIQISGKPLNDRQVSVSFTVLPGSDPFLLGCFISIWEGNHILSTKEALQTERITTRYQSGEVIFSGLAIGKKHYVVAFGLGLNTAMEIVCASLEMPAGENPAANLVVKSSEICVIPDGIGKDFLIAQLPTAFCRRTVCASSWIALFEGGFKTSMYKGEQAIAINKVNPHRNSGKIIMNNILKGLERFETYTLVLGMGVDWRGYPDFSKLVSTYTFIVWKSKIYGGQYSIFSPKVPVSAFFN